MTRHPAPRDRRAPRRPPADARGDTSTCETGRGSGRPDCRPRGASVRGAARVRRQPHGPHRPQRGRSHRVRRLRRRLGQWQRRRQWRRQQLEQRQRLGRRCRAAVGLRERGSRSRRRAVDGQRHRPACRADDLRRGLGPVRWGRDRRDGPEGERTRPTTAPDPCPAPRGSLIARIGDDIFFIGDDRGPIGSAIAGGSIWASTTSARGQLGSFRVTVFY